LTTTLTQNKMNFISLNSEENKNYLIEKDILSAFNQTPTHPNQIKQGMSPKQIAEVVSDHLMTIVKKQFDAAKENYQVNLSDKK